MYQNFRVPVSMHLFDRNTPCLSHYVDDYNDMPRKDLFYYMKFALPQQNNFKSITNEVDSSSQEKCKLCSHQAMYKKA